MKTRQVAGRGSVASRASAVLMAGLLGSCAARAGERGDAGQIGDSLLKVLTSTGQSICVDDATHGEPLAIFRSMLPAPDPARRPLVWSAPAPLEQGRRLTGRELVNDEFRDGRTVLSERTKAKAVLPVTAQLQLNALAREASVMLPDADTAVATSASAPLARVRWWVLNRLDGRCGPAYTLSKPVLLHGMAFVTVTAGHRGSTYAFRKHDAAWAPVAQWSTWLY